MPGVGTCVGTLDGGSICRGLNECEKDEKDWSSSSSAPPSLLFSTPRYSFAVVGRLVGSLKNVGAFVGNNVGVCVGALVGESVGSTVGDLVGVLTGVAVLISGARCAKISVFSPVSSS